MTIKTITLTGEETKVEYSSGANAWLRNDGTDVIYASNSPGISAGEDGVISIPAGQAAAVYGANGAVYLLGIGSVLLVGSDYAECPFKISAQCGSGADDVARAAIEAHTGDGNIHVTAEEKEHWDSKADSSDNYWLYTLDSSGNPHGASHRLRAQFSVKGDSRFYIQDEDGQHPVRVNYADEADTVDGLHASDFALAENPFLNNLLSTATGDVRTLFAHLPSGGYGYNTDEFPDLTGFPITGSVLITWFRSVNSINNYRYGTLQVRSMTNSSLPVYQCGVYNNGAYTDWQKLCDGGNAASIGTYTEAKITALEARIAALEGKLAT